MTESLSKDASRQEADRLSWELYCISSKKHRKYICSQAELTEGLTVTVQCHSKAEGFFVFSKLQLNSKYRKQVLRANCLWSARDSRVVPPSSANGCRLINQRVQLGALSTLSQAGVRSHHALMPITQLQPNQLISETILTTHRCVYVCVSEWVNEKVRVEISCCSGRFVITSSECIILLQYLLYSNYL